MRARKRPWPDLVARAARVRHVLVEAPPLALGEGGLIHDGVDPVLAVHGFSMTDRSHHAATTDSSTWFHSRIHADQWNLLQSRSPAAGRGRGVMTAGLFSADGYRVATMVHEGPAVTRVTDGKG